MRPLVWNEATGHLVEGHQRIDLLDELEGSSDYSLDVSVVTLSDKVEREQNVFLNATTFTGEFDLPALKAMIDGGLDYSAAGLDLYDLNVLGVDAVILKQQAQDNEPDDYEEEVERTPEEKKQAIKEEKARIAERIEGRFDDGEAYVTISFDSYKDKSGWMLKYGFGPSDLFVKGEVLQQIIEQKLKDGF